MDGVDSSKVFTKFRYAAGELQVRLTTDCSYLLEGTTGVTLIKRIRNSDDIMELLLMQNAIDNEIEQSKLTRLTTKNVILPYMPYSRADRMFVPGDCRGKETFISVINSQWPVSENTEYFTFDCHSNNVDTFDDTGQKAYINISALNIISSVLNSILGPNDTELNIIFPDEGTKTRYVDVIEVYNENYTNNIKFNTYFCTKKIEVTTGRFIGFEVPVDLNKTINTIIIDDICDGGWTFNEIAAALRINKKNLFLYVSHGIFSVKFDALGYFFNTIYTTDSFNANAHSCIVSDYNTSLVVFPLRNTFLEKSTNMNYEYH